MTRFLITGGAGFIGSHLCDLLANLGHDVVAIDDLSTGRIDNIRHLQDLPNFQFVRGSIHNHIVLDRLTSECEVVIHLAAAVGVRLIVDDPVHTISTNVNGSEAVLTTANRYGCKVLIASTSEVYGKGVEIPFKEGDDRLMGSTTHSRWAYATSKAIDEYMALAYHRQFSLPVVIMRFFNTIGPRQTGQYGMVVPRFVRQALRDEPLTVYGDGQQSRCFVDVRDIIRAVADLSTHPAAVGEIYNIGATEEITIQQLAERIISLSGSPSTIEYISYDRAYSPGFEDMRRRVPSIDKLTGLLGYKPQYTLDETLLGVIEFEKNNL